MITLINPPGIKTFSGLQMHTPNPPLGLAYIAGALREAGLPYRVIDATGEALGAVSPYPDRADFMVQGLTLDGIVARVHPDTTVIGISCMFSTLWPLTNRVADAVREKFPRAFMVLGGEHGTAVPEHVLATSPFDVVVLGEGEETLVELLRARAAGRPLAEVKGIAYREDGRVVTTGLSPRRREVDTIPAPDWASFPITEYIDRHQTNGINLGRSMPILGTRGCPFQCTFCSNPGMWTQRWIARDPRQLADEMERYVREYRVTNFDFQDLTAIVKRQWIVDFCRELIRRDLAITWQMPSGTRAEVFDDEVADLLYRSGCRALAFAPESGSPDILKAVKKQVDLDHMLTAMRAAVRRGLKLSCFIVIGFPDDTPGTLRQTLRLIRRMAVLGVYDIAVSKFVPYPGSALFKRLQGEGKLSLDNEFFVSPMDFYTAKAPSYADAVSSRRLYWTMLWMFVNFYVISFALRPWRVARALTRALLTGREETRYAKWFVDVLFTRRRWRRLAGGALR
ncbi:MAG TPA: radical SAM protein [Methylomirabilota bacterium]|nr:radical SAM protein [Methylomirabilota bacterium]